MKPDPSAAVPPHAGDGGRLNRRRSNDGLNPLAPEKRDKRDTTERDQQK
jgi:hypothetical protein